MPERPVPEVTPAYFEILVVRELRKAGLEVSDARVYRRSELPEAERGFVLELRAWLRHAQWQRCALIGCRRQMAALGGAAVEAVAARLAEAQADVGLLFAAADYAPDALAAAEERRIALLRVVEARVALELAGWGSPGQYPSWMPAHLVQLVDRGVAGEPRVRLVEPGQADAIIQRCG